MKVVLIVLISMVCLPALAEEKTCTVKGMTCEDCVGHVKEKVCNPEYSVCDVSLIGKGKAKTGQIHLVTKDSAAIVDEKVLNEAMKELTYSVQKCSNGAPKSAKKST